VICPDSAVDLVATAQNSDENCMSAGRSAARRKSAAAHSIVGGKLRARRDTCDKVKLRIFLVCRRQWAKINQAVHGKIVTHCN
jgi:hypothetical protein